MDKYWPVHGDIQWDSTALKLCDPPGNVLSDCRDIKYHYDVLIFENIADVVASFNRV